jgi:hypothetical protein
MPQKNYEGPLRKIKFLRHQEAKDIAVPVQAQIVPRG